MKKTVLREYARLIVRSGLNIQKGQTLIIRAGLDQPEFVQMVVEEAYKAKAKEVIVEWSYQPLTKTHARYQSLKTMAEVKEWELARLEHYCQVLPARLHLLSADPDGLKGVNMSKISKASQMSYPMLKPYQERRENKEQWCVAAVPGVAWAKKVFPGLPKGQAVEKLWEAILSASRVCEDSVQAWVEHGANLLERCEKLNELKIRSLHYTAENGTDFTVGMMAEGVWRGGGDKSLQNIEFNPNIPTEEVFISPKKGQAEGIVYSSMPLSYRGQLIDKFWLRFEGGKAVEVGAEQGEEALKEMVSMDEGAAYLGECALIPQDSPICKSGILFYNTLFDENASCHLAMGRGYADTIDGFENMTREECHKLGLNDSMIHVDFMIGCDSMNIDATCADGSVVRIFENGNWAF
ncbi:MAG: aminopeptidase [Oscillospiraceae bacterium]|nr:aminopeptidase [Oscillospiraceae bacterium]